MRVKTHCIAWHFLQARPEPVMSLDFHPTSYRLVTAGADRTAKLWDVSWNLDADVPPTSNSSSTNPTSDSAVANSKDSAASDSDKPRVDSASTPQKGEEGVKSDPKRGDKGVETEEKRGGKGVEDEGVEGGLRVDFVSTLDRHQQVVNCARWSRDGTRIATGSDDRSILLWKQRDGEYIPPPMAEGEEGEGEKESWGVDRMLRGHVADVYAVSWSPDDSRLLSGSVDNMALVWDTNTGKCIERLHQHSHFVQGVSWDPLDVYLATQSCDRSCRIFEIQKKHKPGQKPKYKHVSRFDLRKVEVPAPLEENIAPTDSKSVDEKKACDKSGGSGGEENVASKAEESGAKEDTGNNNQTCTEITTPSRAEGATKSKPGNKFRTVRLFRGDDAKSYFRRLEWSVEGSYLLVPTGVYVDESQKSTNTMYLFSRTSFPNPLVRFGGFAKPIVAVRWCPALFRKRAEKGDIHTGLPYRQIFAATTGDTVYIYDTENSSAICMASNLHYTDHTDLSWTFDGRFLALSATDGYCTFLSFDAEEIGELLPEEEYPLSYKKARGMITEEELLQQEKNAQPDVKSGAIKPTTVVNMLSVKRKLPTTESTPKLSQQDTKEAPTKEEGATNPVVVNVLAVKRKPSGGGERERERASEKEASEPSTSENIEERETATTSPENPTESTEKVGSGENVENGEVAQNGDKVENAAKGEENAENAKKSGEKQPRSIINLLMPRKKPRVEEH